MANLAASLILLAALAVPSNDGPNLVQPKGPLVLTESGKSPDISAKFSGQITVSGMFVSMRDEESENQALSYAIRPDEASRARLPHFDGYDVTEIGLVEGPAALRMVAGADQAKRLEAGKLDQIAVPGSFVIEGYSVGVECDVQWAEAKLIRADLPSKRVASRAEPIDAC